MLLIIVKFFQKVFKGESTFKRFLKEKGKNAIYSFSGILKNNKEEITLYQSYIFLYEMKKLIFRIRGNILHIWKQQCAQNAYICIHLLKGRQTIH